jgi:hypothetical protein
MGRRVKDFIEISEYTSLDQLINTLTAIRGSLPEESEPELRMKGDDVFGRRMSISYFRELTDEEAACEAKYSGADLPGPNAEIDALTGKLDSVGYEREGRIAKRRIGRAR